MPLIQCTSGDVDVTFKEDSFKEAYRRFFQYVLEEDLVDDVGLVVIADDGEEERPMRTVPALYAAGAIGREVAARSIAKAIDMDPMVVNRDLDELAEKDEWAVKEVA